MDYKNSFKVTISLEPWFSSSYGFTMIHLYEELGGRVSSGEAVLMHDGTGKALKLVDTENYGTLTISKEGGLIYKIPIFIYKKEYDYIRNYLNISFLCGITKKDFVANLHTSTWKDIRAAINALYPGKVDIRCESDIQNKELTYYQNRETDADFLRTLCSSWKRNSIFTFGWEGLMIKETRGKLNSYGQVEGYLEIHGESQLTQLDNHEFRYQPELYKLLKNPWEDKDGTQKEFKDYTDLEPINLRILKRYDKQVFVKTDYLPLVENREFNNLYMGSSYFQHFRVTDQDIPKYKIGDVLKYVRTAESGKSPESKKFNYTYYLVKSNELFISANDSEFLDEDGRHQSWTSTLVGLEERGLYSVGTEVDPLDE